MRSLSALLLIGFIGCSSPAPTESPQTKTAQAEASPMEPASLEPSYGVEYENNFVFQGKPEVEKHSAYTAAELPWIESDSTMVTRLEFGFKQTEEPASSELQGKQVEGKKISWERDKSSSSNVAVAAVHAWVSPELKTPAFMVTLGNKVKFLVPAGCVKLEVVAHQPPGSGIDSTEFSSTLSAKGEYQKPTKFKIGDKEYDAHEFSIEISSEGFNQTNKYVISAEAPAGIFSRVSLLDGKPRSSMELKALAVVPPPDKLEVFANAGFAYAPPPGYEKVTPAKDEVVAYRKGNTSIQVRVIDLPHGGLSELIAAAQKDDKPAHLPKYLTQNSTYHVAGQFSYTGAFPASLVTQHGKRGYIIAVTNLNELPDTEVKQILKGWRWLAEPAKK